MHSTLSGHIKYTVINSDGSPDTDGDNHNLILNSGLDLLATYVYGMAFRYCTVGTGASAPNITQTGLDVETARTANYFFDGTATYNGTTFGVNDSQFLLRRTFEFPIGSLNGTYYEIGFSPISTAGNNLFSRALFKDVSGNPVGVVINASQSLRITYTLTVTIPSTTMAVSATPLVISGIGNIGYSSGLAVSRANASNWYPDTLYLHQTGDCPVYTPIYCIPRFNPIDIYYPSGSSSISPFLEPSFGGNVYHYLNISLYNNPTKTIPTLTTQILVDIIPGTLTPARKTASSVSAYVPGSYSISASFNFTTQDFNGTFDCAVISASNVWNPSAQMFNGLIFLLDTPIVKDNLHTLSLTLTKTWGRA